MKEFQIVLESGLYFITMRSRKAVAKPFQRWLTKEVLPSIRKNGFYISPEISDSQVSNLVEESLSLYENRKLFDLELRELKSEIYGELLNQGATKKEIGSIFANMFQNLHIAVLKKTAGQIVFDKMKTEKREISIKSFNRLLRKQ